MFLTVVPRERSNCSNVEQGLTHDKTLRTLLDVSRLDIIEHSVDPLTEHCAELLTTHTEWREVTMCDENQDKVGRVAV